MAKFDELEARLSVMTRSANVSCRDFTKLLRDLGFHVIDGRKGGHKVVSHPNLIGFSGTNYNCGHNPGTHVRPYYIKHIAGVVTTYSAELRELLK